MTVCDARSVVTQTC